MGEATFSVGKIRPPECYVLDCYRSASLEVSLVGSTVPHAEVCRVHKAWVAEKIRQGFADHVFQGEQENWPCDVPKCSKPDWRHHSDMLDYDALAPHVQAYDIETGIVGFRMGYEAAKRDGAA